MKTIALFGGSFDPPHIGHEAIVKALLNLDYIDRVLVMPTYLNPFKKSSFAPANLRLKWLKEIFSSFEKVEVSSYEVSQGKKVSSLQTVKYLLVNYEKIYLVIGADNLKTLHKWQNFEALNKLVTFIVAARDEIKIDKEFISLKVDKNISSSSLRESMNIHYLTNINAKEIMKYYKENNE